MAVVYETEGIGKSSSSSGGIGKAKDNDVNANVNVNAVPVGWPQRNVSETYGNHAVIAKLTQKQPPSQYPLSWSTHGQNQ